MHLIVMSYDVIFTIFITKIKKLIYLKSQISNRWLGVGDAHKSSILQTLSRNLPNTFQLAKGGFDQGSFRPDAAQCQCSKKWQSQPHSWNFNYTVLSSELLYLHRLELVQCCNKIFGDNLRH
jgi:hypothetical protein